jgi:hypothetical protein
MVTPDNNEASDLFDVLCERVEALSPTDVQDFAKPFALVFGESSFEWFGSFAEAAVSARQRFAPETYVISNPLAEPDYVPMVFVQQPFANS